MQNDVNATSEASPKINRKPKKMFLQSENSKFPSMKTQLNENLNYSLGFRVEVDFLESLVHLRTRKICVFLENRFC